ncbi:MAG TPA: 1,2-phenylacetyl-CoA epoxidase subunit PaaD [Anaerolineales bacterium]|nr:1,2-phenylacetyl-CoA epoxidase subunit PaaD [Anaerolineales bacterium]
MKKNRESGIRPPSILSETDPQLTEPDILAALETVMDPEIPVVSLVEMGIVRRIDVDEEKVTVTITPTFSGCPALAVMQRDILRRLEEIGAQEPRVELSLSPPWSTDWITPSARRKLADFGIRPPAAHGGNIDLVLFDPVACTNCGSENTSLRNSFGSTPCRMIYVCNNCREPFERMKPL